MSSKQEIEIPDHWPEWTRQVDLEASRIDPASGIEPGEIPGQWRGRDRDRKLLGPDHWRAKAEEVGVGTPLGRAFQGFAWITGIIKEWAEEKGIQL